jgi:hypothetical protein
MPWFNREIKSAINKRDKLYKKLAANNNTQNYQCSKTQANLVSNLVTQAKIQHREKKCQSLSTANPRSYWSLIKKLLGKTFCGNIPTLDFKDTTAYNDSDKANLFLRKFIDKFHHTHDDTVIPVCHPKTRSTLQNIAVG